MAEAYSTTGDYGIRTLYEPENANVDIVFIHGLTGNRETTWSFKPTKQFWPQNLLPKDLPTARITTFGYDADIIGALKIAGSNTIRDHGKALAHELAVWRKRTKSNRRPLIFVAHSLGGLVTEQALLISRGAAQQYYKDIFESTVAIAFMGTPHFGSNKAAWAVPLTRLANVLRTANKEIMQVLAPGSEMLANLQQEFHSMLEDYRQNHGKTLKIFCFYEEVEVTGVGKIVPDHSAILSSYQNRSIHAERVVHPFDWAHQLGAQAPRPLPAPLTRDLFSGLKARAQKNTQVPHLSPKGGAVISNLTASRDININHITTIRPLAQSLYHSCFNSSDIFNQARNDLGLLVSVLDVTQKYISDRQSNDAQSPELDRALASCYEVLTDLSRMKEHFDSVGYQAQTTWERMGWSTDELAEMRARLSICIQTLNLLATTEKRYSEANIQRILEGIFEEIRSGKRDGSAVSSFMGDTVAMTEKEKWREIRKELQTVGITSEMFSRHIEFIKGTIATAVHEGALGDSALGNIYTELQHNSDSKPFPASASRKRPSTKKKASLTRLEASEQMKQKELNDSRQNRVQLEEVLGADRKRPSRIARMLYAVSHDVSDLYQAIDSSNSFNVQRLVEKGADVRKGLDFAIRGRNVAMVKHLVVYFGGHSAAIKEAFELAAEMAHRDMARAILEHMDDAGKTHAMMHSAEFGYSWTVRIFKEFGKGPNTYLNGTTALILAAEYGYVNYAEVLLKNGADVNLQTGKYLSYTTAFGAAMKNSSPSLRFKMAKLFISYGIDVHGGNGSQSPLTMAQALGQQNIIKLLKKAGATY
ncbi:hypothetical protein PENANT_c036G02396 [Penicillium antarcticum]|uniref:DUF676 domain-containing protein n=1 Tax=Penicillium antarcticum TaxID=416450 RepID=A0A1V6PTW6_9EURO|nr:hypothetical protein PENANT_c036G02396 [Penicillium antarcticum]